ncbi:amidohydrolase [Salimicrobium halophilum]|uniref:Amidohydrolase n=1 Tax=Salimicrobium halophilum TaxID=86666 RepID=A0A1G8T7W7_9BACI|nr:amidohydrolase [Salimicrobium halophilum]SDJ37487.1 amidohydrolase [Salimicrobium halophilum]
MEYTQTLERTYQELHRLAEPSGREEKTSLYLKQRLREVGYEIHEFPGHYGFYVEWPGEQEEVIALRADMDALLQEVKGEVRANHSCGHDAHSTMVLHTALRVAREAKKYTHTVRFLFQPAEEIAAGALEMMHSNALKNVVFLGGIHLRPEREVPSGKAAPAIRHGAIVSLKGKVTGTPAHAARPEDGNNPIEISAELMERFRSISIEEPFSFKVTEFHGGEASNAIPATCIWTYDIRCHTNEGLDELTDRAEEEMERLESETGADISFSLEEFSPAARVNRRAVQKAEKAIGKVSGEEAVDGICESPGAEDFHFYTYHHPEIEATMIGLGCGLKPGLHHPEMTFDTTALCFGMEILYELLKEADRSTYNKE